MPQCIYLSSATGQNMSDIRDGKPGNAGKMVVSLATIEDCDGFRLTNPAIINRSYWFSGSASTATEFTLSGSNFTDLR